LSNLLATGDPHPHVFGIVNGPWYVHLSNVGNLSQKGYGAASRFGTALTTKVALATLHFAGSGEEYRAITGVNSINSREDTIPCHWVRPGTAPGGGSRGLKGESTLFRQPATVRSNGDNLTTTITREFMHANGLYVPWAASSVAGVR
jgi:hypothetical protein